MGGKKRSFWERIIYSAFGCWRWVGQRDSDGYGVLTYKFKNKRAHRLMWELTQGDPGKLVVMHICDNPCCVNPEHMKLGTVRENNEDRAKKGRSHRPFGNKKWTFRKNMRANQ